MTRTALSNLDSETQRLEKTVERLKGPLETVGKAGPGEQCAAPPIRIRQINMVLLTEWLIQCPALFFDWLEANDTGLPCLQKRMIRLSPFAQPKCADINDSNDLEPTAPADRPGSPLYWSFLPQHDPSRAPHPVANLGFHFGGSGADQHFSQHGSVAQPLAVVERRPIEDGWSQTAPVGVARRDVPHLETQFG
jgi:hypothetical protein